MLCEQLSVYAAEQPLRPFVIEAETGRTLSYGEAPAAVAAVRALLGDVPCCVALALPNGIANAVLWLSALDGGHSLVPLPPDAPAAELQRRLRRFAPDVLVVERAEDAGDFGYPGARVLTLPTCEAAIFGGQPQGQPVARPASRAGWVCLTTSGSTGEPKGIVLGESQIAYTAEQVRRAHALGPDECGLTVLPFFHVNAPVVSLSASLLAGGTVVVARRFSTRAFWEWVERYQVSWVSLVPTVLAFLLRSERPAHLPGRLRFVRSASAPLPVVQLRAFERRFGIPVVETYGLTEAASQVAANPVPPGRRKPGSVGLPVGVSLRVCEPPVQESGDAALRDVAAGAVGEICVAGPGVISGYLGDAAPAAFRDGWFRTGDLGYLDADGYLYVTGRLRDVIIRGGENVAPREVEEVLLGDPAVRDAAVVGEPDALYGQRVVAYVVPAHPGWGSDDAAAVRDRCATALAGYKVPERIIAVSALPRTRSGKIQRHLLREAPAALAVG